MTGAYDSATNHNIKGFKKILAGGLFYNFWMCCCKSNAMIHLHLGMLSAVNIGTATDMHGQDPTVGCSSHAFSFCLGCTLMALYYGIIL